MCRRIARRVRDLRHKATRQFIDFYLKRKVGSLFIGNPHGVRRENKGRHHNQRMSLWEYGKDMCAIEARSRLLRKCNTSGVEELKAAAYLAPKGEQGTVACR